MPLEGEYAPSADQGVRDQVEQIESSGGTAGTTTKGTPVVVITMRGAKSGKLRKVPVMRVEHDGVYAAVASLGGAPDNPAWYHNLVANRRVELQDGPVRRAFTAREVHGAEKELLGAVRGCLSGVRRLTGTYRAADSGVRARVAQGSEAGGRGSYFPPRR